MASLKKGKSSSPAEPNRPARRLLQAHGRTPRPRRCGHSDIPLRPGVPASRRRHVREQESPTPSSGEKSANLSNRRKQQGTNWQRVRLACFRSAAWRPWREGPTGADGCRRGDAHCSAWPCACCRIVALLRCVAAGRRRRLRRCRRDHAGPGRAVCRGLCRDAHERRCALRAPAQAARRLVKPSADAETHRAKRAHIPARALSRPGQPPQRPVSPGHCSKLTCPDSPASPGPQRR